MKMKGTKMLSLALAAGVTAGLLTGCGATTEKIVDRMYSDEFNSSANEMEFDVNVEYASQGMSMEVGVNGDMEYEVCKDGDDTTSHAIVNAKLVLPEMFSSYLGDSDKFSTELYTTGNNEEQTTYMYNEDEGLWNVSTIEVGDTLDEETQEELTEAIKQVMYKAELQKKTEEMNGEKCYVLKLNATGEDFEEIIDLLMALENEDGEILGEMLAEELDCSEKDIKSLMSYVVVDMTMYVSKKNGYCVRSEVDLSQTDLAGMVKEGMDIAGVTEDDLGGMFSPDGLSFKSFSIINNASEVNNTEVAIPGDVEDEAIEVGAL